MPIYSTMRDCGCDRLENTTTFMLGMVTRVKRIMLSLKGAYRDI